MTTTDDRRARNDERVAADVREHGCHVVSVFDPEERLPTFSYSIGIKQSAGAPDAIVIGVQPKLGHWLVNEYCRRVRAGAVFLRGTKYEGFLVGFSVFVEPARQALHQEYTLGCKRFYKAAEYSVVQIIYPTTKGAWPWQKTASEWFRSNQPMLGRKRLDRR